MSNAERSIILGIGNIYVETNYLGLETAGNDVLEAGREYAAKTYETRLGGSVVNFVLQAKALGASVGLIGKTGMDEQGDKLRKLLEGQGICHDMVVSSPDVQTSVDTGVVFTHNGQNIQLVSGNANKMLSGNDINLNNPFFSSVQAVYMGGFLKQESLYKDYPDLLEKMSMQGIQLFLDHGRIPVDVSDDKKRTLVESLKYVDCYLPNEDELMGFTGSSTIDEALTKAIELGPRIIAVKLGAKGCRVKSKDEDITIAGYQITPITTVGAGDCFNAGFITTLLKGNSLRECAEIANATAALKVSKNIHPSLRDVQAFLGK